MFQVSHQFSNLPPLFFSEVQPTPVAAPSFIAFNQALATDLAMPSDFWQTTAGLHLYSGQQLPSWTRSIACAYTGHQFGQLNPRLGDGRAILLAELKDAQGNCWDLQLKGAGPTPYSRRGDGRAALGPVMREYVLSEAMHALGVPTTRALAAVQTGQAVYRERPLPGAVITRVASSFLRVGSFQYAAMYGTPDEQKALLDFAISRHYPECQQSDNPALAFLAAVQQRQAALIAKWMSLGFIHGVMNTDNMAISGETIDYGPCAFMDTYRADTVFSSIDTGGRYAYQQQPVIAQWNLARLAESLLGLIDKDEQTAVQLATDVLNQFAPIYYTHWRECFGHKLGIFKPSPADHQLIVALLELLEQQEIDFTQFFRMLGHALIDSNAPQGPAGLFAAPNAWHHWWQRWQQRLAEQWSEVTEPQSSQEDVSTQLLAITAAQMQQANPAFIPRNQLIEDMIAAAVEQQDFTLFHDFLQDLSRPYQDIARWMQVPPKPMTCYKTFCGT